MQAFGPATECCGGALLFAGLVCNRNRKNQPVYSPGFVAASAIRGGMLPGKSICLDYSRSSV
jgi:hypothetical protein